MNESVRRTRAAWTRIFARTAPVPVSTPVGVPDLDDTVEARFDTSGLELQDDVQGFDPYSHGRLATGARATRQRTDLRALSAQILAERARKKTTG